MRINKLFSNLGICSRKETNKLIQEGRVKVNGKQSILGQWVEEDDEILLDGNKVSIKKKVYIALNKPVGIVCTSEKNVNDNIIKFLNYPQYIFPVGRLDKESQGLIIMTNDGELANEILEAENNHEKEYIVTVDKNFEDDFLEKMSQGIEIPGFQSTGIKRVSDILGIKEVNGNKELVVLEEEFKRGKSSVHKFKELKSSDSNEELQNLINQQNTIKLNENNTLNKNKVRTKPCKVTRINENTFKIILTQGLNKQIRKMTWALGYKVVKLERVRIINISIDGIELGKWRKISEDEINELKKAIQYNDINKPGNNYLGNKNI